MARAWRRRRSARPRSEAQSLRTGKALGIVEDLLEIGQRSHRGIQRAQELLGIGGEVGQARDVVCAGHLGPAVFEEWAPLASVIDVPRGLVGRPLQERLHLALQEVLERRPDRPGVEPLGLVCLRQPDPGCVIDPVPHVTPVLHDMAEDQAIECGLDAMRQLQPGAGLDIDDPEDRAGLRFFADDQVGAAVGHLNDRAVDPVPRVEGRRRDQGRLIDRLARLQARQDPSRLRGTPDAVLQPSVRLRVGDEDLALEPVGNDLLFPGVAAFQDRRRDRTVIEGRLGHTLDGPQLLGRAGIAEVSRALLEEVSCNPRRTDQLRRRRGGGRNRFSDGLPAFSRRRTHRSRRLLCGGCG